MKALLWQGHRIETDDQVADAAFDLARLLTSTGRTESIDIPVEIAGHASTASLVVGAGVALGLLALPDVPDHPLPGSDEAVAGMRERIARLDGSSHSTEYRLPDDFSVLDHDIAT